MIRDKKLGSISGRRAVLLELKPAYYRQADRNLERAGDSVLTQEAPSLAFMADQDKDQFTVLQGLE